MVYFGKVIPKVTQQCDFKDIFAVWQAFALFGVGVMQLALDTRVGLSYQGGAPCRGLWSPEPRTSNGSAANVNQNNEV